MKNVNLTEQKKLDHTLIQLQKNNKNKIIAKHNPHHIKAPHKRRFYSNIILGLKKVVLDINSVYLSLCIGNL